ncbi:hypothetical protein GWO43_03030 [candidate division KSB1 bacterium]|nr:hypothetical protein [candidate division KSB1 bacterium]NIR69999.1 hypothetical protein [candidate division KSB1 bacterium]NIS23022.1 hypothetical protein [candidate division KSB1 bacterium]NIT69880.1 hypothetical protein [candidate division KSB1 bacterium]NIU23529.1 hypothetical protein [candidate division KSB1 bacterium]
MNLSETTDSSDINHVDIHTGSGNFLIEGGHGHKEKLITVFYHKPENFTSQSRILIIVPGSGRDGGKYRDAWVEASEKYSVLILSPAYKEHDYGFEDYHMGAVIEQSNMLNQVTFMENSNIVELDEEGLTFQINSTERKWIFNDFDRMFESVAIAVGSSQESYDMFGHSAGGQILHRLVLFHPDTKANRILASNSGFYTLPDFNTELPFGLKNTPVDKRSLRTSFKKHLVLFIGEMDNEHETGGIMLRSPTVDEQGTHRLERSQYFYKKAKETAKELEAGFNWKLRIVPDVGHNFKRMSEAAAKYLYRE